MIISENIKELRTHLRMTQQEFADRIGVKRNTVATYEMGRSVPSEAAITLICREFDVRREWLENGEGDMFIKRSSTIFAQLVKEYNLQGSSLKFLENFLSLTPENRDLVAKAVEVAATLMYRKPDSELTKEEAMAQVGREWEDKEAARKRGTTTSSASITTSGLKEKFVTKS